MVPDGSASPQPQQDATVVVADVAGFTALAETLDPEAVTELINRCFSALEDVISAHGGMVVQYIGDCVLAVFGLGEAETAAPRRGVTAARAMRAAIREMTGIDGKPVALDLHIGIATGPVTAGGIGDGRGERHGRGRAQGRAARVDVRAGWHPPLSPHDRRSRRRRPAIHRGGAGDSDGEKLRTPSCQDEG